MMREAGVERLMWCVILNSSFAVKVKLLNVSEV